MSRTHYAALKCAQEAMQLFCQFGSWAHVRVTMHVRSLDMSNEHLQLVVIDNVLADLEG
jgi:hypothetical protein